VIESLAGHLSRKMLEHYSHVRRAARRAAIDMLPGGLMPATCPPASDSPNPVTSQFMSQDYHAIRER
jgi:hypothetical protein